VSQADVEVVQATIAAFNGGGIEAALQYLDDEIEWVGPPEWLEKHLYEGHDGMREIAGYWTESFDEYRLEADEFIDAGERVVVLAHQRGRLKGGAPIEDKISYVWTLRDGKAVHVQVYFTWEQALAEVGRTPEGNASQ
jgi:ketosteroid isomerase-like protein